MNYYNEWDKKTAAWLQELINEGLIPDGHIDTRSICDVQPGDLDGYTQCHFFAGVAGWPLALQLAGWGADRPIWTGSCPCQPFSAAGKQKGTADERHVWPEMFRLARFCRPDTIFGEQVEGAVRLGWLDGVFADLEGEGYACGAAVLGAHSVGAPHIRQRLYWVADAQCWPTERHGHELAGAARGVQGEARQRQRLRDDAGDGCADSRLVNTNGAGPQQGQQAAEAARYGSAAESAGSHSEWLRVIHSCECDEEGNCPVCGIDYAECPCPGPTQEDEFEYDERADGLWARRLGNSIKSGLEGFSGNVTDWNKSRRDNENSIRSTSETGRIGCWQGSTTIPCADGKSRRVKPGIQLLAHGVPARVVRLRGYGNAIVPACAQAFIEAYMETAK